MLNERYKKADEKIARLKAEREDHLTRGKGIRRFLSALDGQPQSLEDWDEQAWNLLVSRVIIAEIIVRGETKRQYELDPDESKALLDFALSLLYEKR